MGKSKRSDKEYTREQRLVQENRVLKRQVAALRKELARIDLNRYKDLKETIEKHYQEDRAQEGQNLLEKIKNEWKCHEEGCLGFLEIFTYNKVDATYYYRICSEAPRCKNRTKSQKWTPAVKGVMRKT